MLDEELYSDMRPAVVVGPLTVPRQRRHDQVMHVAYRCPKKKRRVPLSLQKDCEVILREKHGASAFNKYGNCVGRTVPNPVVNRGRGRSRICNRNQCRHGDDMVCQRRLPSCLFHLITLYYFDKRHENACRDPFFISCWRTKEEEWETAGV